jgi:hypothetical protein
MNVVFNHQQDHSPQLDGVTVHDRKELFALLDSFKGREPFVGELIGENGYKLMLGIGDEIGCVQYSPSNGEAPYLMAVAPGDYPESEYVEFLMGNTPTPVPKRFCLPFGIVKEIAAHFIETGERSPAVSWEEI